MADVAALNRLRRRIREAWNAPNKPTPLLFIERKDDDYDPDVLRTDLKTIASELGLRYLPLPLDGDLSSEQEQTLARRGDRMVVISGIDTFPSDGRLSERISAAAKTLPVILAPLPPDEAERVTTAWAELSRLQRERAEREARYAALGIAVD